LAPAKTLGDMTRIAFNDNLDAMLAVVFMVVVLSTLVYALISIRRALVAPIITTSEIGAVVLAGGTR